MRNYPLSYSGADGAVIGVRRLRAPAWYTMIEKMRPLPIDDLIPEILTHLRAGPNLVIEAPPGAGKTTRVPPAMLALSPGKVLVLEPRRLAARLAARHVAAERGEKPGETVGYQVRFEDVSGRSTRLKFMTEGVLTRLLLSDPELRGVSAVVLDEFHERHLEGDVALALLRRLQRERRKDLRLVVMSATLNAAPVAEYLGGCPVVRSEGRVFDLDVRWTPHSAAPIEELVGAALERLLAEGDGGHILVFLPGAAEIRRAARPCEPLARRYGLALLPLHGDLPPEEQDRAVGPSRQRKVILSTNVAESSVTIDGVTAVIDSGLARVAEDSPWTGIPSLRVARVSRSSATQRAGRAARTAPGCAIRLYSAEDFARRPEQDIPEIRRRELAQVLLDLHAMGVRDPLDLPWFDAPPKESLQAAELLLRRLGALDEASRITGAGRKMAELPLHPRLARLVLDGGELGCKAAAALSAGERLAGAPPHGSASDLLLLTERDWSPRTVQLYRQIREAAGGRAVRKQGEQAPLRNSRTTEPRRLEDTAGFSPVGRAAAGPCALLKAILRAFPDRVARRRQGRELLLAGGGGAILAEESAVRDHSLIVAVDVEERRERGLPLVRLASGIEPEWLFDFFPERMQDVSTVEWNRAASRVEQTGALLYDGLPIETTRGGMPDPAAASALLAEKAAEEGVERFVDSAELAEFLARVEFAASHGAVLRLGEKDARAALAEACTGLRSFAELKAALADCGIVDRLKQELPDRQRRMLEELAPERIRLPGGRTARVRYENGKPPWVAARLQEFFGVREGPRVAGGKEPLVLHLLAPSMRPVQTTTDLAGFWERLYPQVRRELMRRYPKHSWPEKPV